jgi:hypothetical protein
MIMDISKGAGVSEEAARQKIMDMLGGIPVGGRAPLRRLRS